MKHRVVIRSIHSNTKALFLFWFLVAYRPILTAGVIFELPYPLHDADSYITISCPVTSAMLFLIDLDLLAAFASFFETVELQQWLFDFFDLQSLVGAGSEEPQNSCRGSEVAG
jgi:hypothetical protein